MAVEGHTHHRNCSEESTGNVPNLNSVINNGVNDELLKYDTNSDENGDNGQHGNILE